MEEWIYKKKKIKSIEDLPADIIGYVYKITHIPTGKLYIGKKALHHSRRTKISKREKIASSTRKVFKKTVKESDWLIYYGSSLELKKDITLLGKENFSREILEVCYNKKYLSYCELVYQIKYEVLSIDSYNANILSKFFRRDVINKKII